MVLRCHCFQVIFFLGLSDMAMGFLLFPGGDV